MKYLIVLLAVVLVSTVHASEVLDTKIVQMSINKQYGSYVFIKLENSAARISCSTNGHWDYTLSIQTEADKAMYSTLLSAYMAGKKVNIYGFSTPVCNEFPSVESMAGFNVL